MLLFLLTLSCQSDPAPVSEEDSESTSAPTDTETTGDTGTECDPALDWWSVGQPTMLSWCTGCHSSNLEGDDRHGAPEGVNLDTLAGVQEQADAIRARAILSNDMPPGGGLPADVRAQLEAWLDCGAEGEENPLPGTEPGEVATARGVAIEVGHGDNFSGGLTLERWVTGGEGWEKVPLCEDYYVVQNTEAWFAGYAVYNDDGAMIRRVELEPPILMTMEGDEEWEHLVEAEVFDGETTTTTEATWVVTIGEPVSLDGRALERNPVEVIMVDDSGEIHAWQLSGRYRISARWFSWGEQQYAALQQQDWYPSDDLPLNAFPIEIGDEWEAGILISEGGVW
jgi:hypothetical protein